MSYVLITPIKDEVQNIPQLKVSILNQTMLPVAWIIVDGGSTDGSVDLAEKLLSDYEWVKILHQRFFYGSGYENMSAAINEGYDFVKKQCANNHTSFSYVGKTDATSILQPDYFETLYGVMEEDAQLAFTCGIERLVYQGKIRELRPTGNFSNTGYNDVRLYRKQFFEEVGAYPLTPFPDGCIQLKAANRGWKYQIVERTSYDEPRLPGAKNGVWAGYKAKGTDMYALGYHPILMLLWAIDHSIKLPPHYQIVPTALGYVSSAVRREKKIEDDEIVSYYGRQRLTELWNDSLSSFKS